MSSVRLNEVVNQFVDLEQPAIFDDNQLGLINDTYFVKKIDEVDYSYVLQKINIKVFQQIEYLENNLSLFAKIKDPIFNNYPKVILAKNGKILFKDKHGNYWRLIEYIKNSVSYESLASSGQEIKSAALVAGQFQSVLNKQDPEKYQLTIANFHSYAFRRVKLEEALEQASPAWINQAQGLLATIDELEPSSSEIDEKKLAERVVHYDLKLSNILCSQDSKEAVAVIDYDTIMPGYLFYDFGDFCRSVAVGAPEDSEDLSKINVNQDALSAACHYIMPMKSVITGHELSSLVYGPRYITLVLAIRFLTDHLAGDVYFKTSKTNHNLIRAQNQLHLAGLFRDQEDYILNCLNHL